MLHVFVVFTKKTLMGILVCIYTGKPNLKLALIHAVDVVFGVTKLKANNKVHCKMKLYNSACIFTWCF